jgi:hypothetical protein
MVSFSSLALENVVAFVSSINEAYLSGLDFTLYVYSY